MERSRRIQFWSVGVLTLALCGGAVFGMKYGIREDAAVIAAGTSDAGPAEGARTRILLGEDGKAGGTVTICQGGFYRVSGTLEEGQLCVDAADGEEVVLCLAGVRIKNSSEAAVYIKNAERTTILLDEGTEATEEEDSMPSCKGLKSGVGTEISGGTFTIDACDDAVHSDGTVLVSDGALFIQSGDDGIHADTELTVAGGTVEVETCYEGLEASQIQIGDGEIRITSSDDGINANGGPNGWMGRGMGDREAVETAEEEMPNLCISGGTVLVDAGGDGLDSNGNLTILGGTVIVDGPSDNGNGALDSGSESGGRCEVHGGLVLAIGSSGMAESFEDGSRQVSFSCRLPSAFQAGSVITVTDREGQVLCTHTAAKEGSSVVFSCPALTEGETVLLEVDGETQEIEI